MAKKLPFLFDAAALYCEEENLGEECFIRNNFDDRYIEQDLVWGDEELRFLLSKEEENNLHDILEKNPSLSDARTEAVEWILEMNGGHNFSAQTALLAVNYLDRFLGSSVVESQTQKPPWMSQLAAVACISLAAKVEETQAPLLLDFQVEESEFMFEAKTIERMELLVLSSLQWRMNPVTPFTFLDYIARRLGLKNALYSEFLRRCGHVIISISSDCRFMCYLPSVVASATMLHVIKKLEPCIGIEESQEQLLLGILGTNREEVEKCWRLIREVASRFEFDRAQKRRIPGSPKGVMDVSFSSESSNHSWPICSSREPLLKKTRTQEHPKH
ncbi:PREDICTED: cyclin-D3-1-like [Ipomoea nil]|uniref:cyclin-D3-1-like n=1 Tax=Ipomoea nil TaxID=35883 RepID=UPI000901EF08|nr:PREDICTED: cyclin-D3-1-like [Ipomoea nil]